MKKLLMVTNDAGFRDDFFSQMGMFAGETTLVESAPDVIIVDEDEEYYNKLRLQYPNIPMILLSSSKQDKSDFLNTIVAKPFSLMRILDVLRSINNKLDGSVDGYLRFNGYELRPNSKEIFDLTSNTVIKLTEKEVDIIKYLYKTADSYITKSDLQKSVWQYNENVTTHTIETHIYRVRQKVEQKCKRRLILTNDGGYKLNMGE